ncbi:MAG: PEP/pyruvate-binding domain-containing protein, partial [Candidatus Heimdallarchaeaceae archaeon]
MSNTVQEKRMYMELKPKYNVFFELMPNRIRNVLLVSSIYDSFMLEEDGRLSDQIYEEFQNLNLRTLPRITRVSSASEALELLKKGEKYDLIITMRRLGEMDAFTFGKKVKEIDQIPVVLLLNSVVEINYLPDKEKQKGIDRIFVWNGDSKIFVAIIKHLEDKMNVDHDIEVANVRVFLFIEDSIRFASLLLPELYAEIMRQTHDLLTEGTNDFHDLLKMRIRPKILLTDNYEEALSYYYKYKNNILGIISDVEFYHNGAIDKEAGFKLAELIREESINLPIAIQSTDTQHRERAEKIGCYFIDKCSHGMLWDLRRWLLDYVGFGAFYFKTKEGDVVAKAKDILEFYHALEKVPLESLFYHGSNDHFSNWLNARGEFEIAEILRPRKVSEFHGEDLREFLKKTIYEIVREKTRGIINDFSRENYHPDILFLRLRPGSLGGKGRGIAFLMFLLNSFPIEEEFPNIRIDIPKTIAIGTDEFDRFMEENALYDLASSEVSDEEIRRRFVNAKLSDNLRSDLRFILADLHAPLAVRSSSILEDSAYQPFAGIFETYMLPNNSPDIDERLEQLCTAIKLVFASPFLKAAKAYSEAISQVVEESKMAVIIQEVVGKKHEDRYYPDFSGTASSYNFYPIGDRVKPEDRVAHLALGLGRIIVDDGVSYSFCPKYPEINFYSTQDTLLKTSQKWFYAIDLSKKDFDIELPDPYVRKFSLSDAIKDGTLTNVADTYDFHSDMLRPGYYGNGSPIITFSKVLKYNVLPLPKLLSTILSIGERTMGSSVEIEFAVNFSEKAGEPHEFYLLQIRPFLQ